MAGSTFHSVCSAATVSLPNTSKAVSSGRMGTAVCAVIAPASGLAAISCSVAPVSVSPCSTAQFTGTRPRYLGKSEPCML
jgi:hypothetical protein